MFKSIFTNTTATLSITSVLICILAGIILGLIISITHMKTTEYSKNFVITLALLPILVQVVMLMVNGNLGTSVAILGAFSLVRFRSIPGNSREIISVFFAMAIGLALGMGHILFASLITIIVSLTLFIMSKTSFGEKKANIRILKIDIPESLNYIDAFDEVFDKYLKEYNIKRVKTTNMGSMYELTYKIVLNDINKEKEFIDDLRCRNGNLKILLEVCDTNLSEL